MKRRPLAWLTISIAAAFALALSPIVASADHGKDSARGSYTTFFGNVKVDFNAQSSALGTDVRGSAKWTFTDFDPNVVVDGTATCLTVVGGFAGIGGEITSVHGGSGLNPQCPTCKGFLIQVFDSGKFSNNPDFELYTFLATPPAACPTSFSLSPVADGEIVVHNSAP